KIGGGGHRRGFVGLGIGGQGVVHFEWHPSRDCRLLQGDVARGHDVGVRELAERPPVLPDDLLIVVAPQDEIYGMARMYEMIGSRTRDHLHIVRSLADAYALL